MPQEVIGMPSSYVILDLETTGLSPNNDCIIEIGAIKVINNKVSKKVFSMLVYPACEYIPARITNLTGITQGMIDQYAIRSADALAAFEYFVKDLPILGWNTKFDVSFMDSHYKYYLNKPFNHDYIDLIKLAKIIKPNEENYKLKTIAKAYHYKNKDEHRAMGDCAATLKIYKGMQRDISEKPYLWQTLKHHRLPFKN